MRPNRTLDGCSSVSNRPVKEAVQFCASPMFLLSEGHSAFSIREWLSSEPRPKTRRILSCILHERKAPILRGNSGIVWCKLQILNYLRLRGGPGRDRTDDLFHAMEARSQLRHRPTIGGQLFYCRRWRLVRQTPEDLPRRGSGRPCASASRAPPRPRAKPSSCYCTGTARTYT